MEVRLRSVIVGVAVSVNIFSGLAAVAWLGLRPAEGQPITAIFPPSFSRAEAMSAAASTDARIVGLARWGAAVIVGFNEPAVISRLHAAGALLIINAKPFTGCLGAADKGA